jgi:hypothetical protein
MEEHEQFQVLIAKQARLLNRIKALVQRIKELAVFLEKSQEQQRMCMGSSYCRNPGPAKPHRP